MKNAYYVAAVAGIALASLAVLRSQQQMVEQMVAGRQFGTVPGFVVEKVNPVDNTDTLVVLTFDANGQPVVSKEFEGPTRLIDADGDGIWESEQLITDQVTTCQGLWFDGPVLYGTCIGVRTEDEEAARQARLEAELANQGDGVAGKVISGTRNFAGPQAGFFRMTDTDGDGVADQVEEVAELLGTIEDHGAHAIRRGPDGAIMYMSGNNAGAPLNERINPESLILDDQESQLLPYLPDFGLSQRAGVHSNVERFDPATGMFTIVTGGNRNAYDLAYNLDGEAFSFDSDMEPEIGVPWYREVRSVHWIPGGNYGYRNGSGKYPPYYIDSLPPMRDLDRGSPVGIETYQSYAYPSEYFDNLFEADWSRGRVLYTALTPNGATYRTRDDRAELIHGEPLNVTDIEVGPDGMLYFTTGGRRSAGGFWRLRYTGPVPAQPDMTGILAVVRQPQPLSSWGWAAIERVRAQMGDAFGAALEQVARDASADAMDRARALYEMQRHGAPPSDALLLDMMTGTPRAVRAAAVFIAGLHQGPAAVQAIGAGFDDADPFVRRRALEAVVRMGQWPTRPSLVPAGAIYELLGDGDRFVRWAARIAIERTPRADWADRVPGETDTTRVMEAMLAWVRTADGVGLDDMTEKQLALLADGSLTVEDRLRLLRVLHYTAIETPGGLDAAARARLYEIAAPQFPAGDERLNYELSLTLAYTQQPGAIGEILAVMPEGDDNEELQLQYLYALRTITDGWTADQKQQLIDIYARAVTWRGGIFNFVTDMFDQSLAVFTPEEQETAYAAIPALAPLAPGAANAGGRGGFGGGGGPGLTRREAFERLIFLPDTPGRGGRGGPAPAPDPLAPQRAFEASCASCHAFGSVGVAYGPDLTGHGLTRRQILEALFFPDQDITPGYETSVIETTDGTTFRGLVVREDDTSLALKTPLGQDPLVLQKALIRERDTGDGTIMPDFFEQTPQVDFDALADFLLAEPPQ